MARITRLPVEIINEIVLHLRATDDDQTLRALSQTSWRFREILAPEVFCKLVLDFQNPSACAVLESLSATQCITRAAVCKHTKAVEVKLANLMPLERHLYAPLGAIFNDMGAEFPPEILEKRHLEIETIWNYLGEVITSLKSCQSVTIHTTPEHQYTPLWAVDIISTALASLPNLVDLEIWIRDQVPIEPLIKENSCLALRRFSIIFPYYFDSQYTLDFDSYDVRVLLNTIDIAVSGKPHLETLEIWGWVAFGCPGNTTQYVGPILDGPRLSKSPPLQIKTLKLGRLIFDTDHVRGILPHILQLENLHLRWVVRGGLFWEMLRAYKIFLRSLILLCPLGILQKETKELTEYLTSYSTLEQLIIRRAQYPRRRWDLLEQLPETGGWVVYGLTGMEPVFRTQRSLKRLEILSRWSSLPANHSFLLQASALEELTIAVGAGQLEQILATVQRMPRLWNLRLFPAAGTPDDSPAQIQWLHAGVVRQMVQLLLTVNLGVGNYPVQRISVNSVYLDGVGVLEFRRTGRVLEPGWVDNNGFWEEVGRDWIYLNVWTLSNLQGTHDAWYREPKSTEEVSMRQALYAQL